MPTHELIPEEILIGVIKLGNFKEFTAPTSLLHKIIYDLKKNPDFSSVLESFRFSGSPVAPFSDVLDGAIFNLQYGNKLKRSNPDLIEYKVSENIDSYFAKQVSTKLTEQDISILTQIAKSIEGILPNVTH